MRIFLLSTILILLELCSNCLYAQESQLNARALLQKSIAYHDPQGNWMHFQGTIYLRGSLPRRSPNYSVITFHNERDIYKSTRKINGKMITGGVSQGACFAQVNGDSHLSAESVETYNLGCEEILKMRNYHLHMLGMPMKLMERGIQINPKVRLVFFGGSPCYEISVKYLKSAVKESWKYYFHPETYALSGYRFSPDDSEKHSTGDFVLLEEELEIHAIKFPKVRRWYNSNHTPIGTDELMEGKYLREADRMVISRGN